MAPRESSTRIASEQSPKAAWKASQSPHLRSTACPDSACRSSIPDGRASDSAGPAIRLWVCCAARRRPRECRGGGAAGPVLALQARHRRWRCAVGTGAWTFCNCGGKQGQRLLCIEFLAPRSACCLLSRIASLLSLYTRDFVFLCRHFEVWWTRFERFQTPPPLKIGPYPSRHANIGRAYPCIFVQASAAGSEPGNGSCRLRWAYSCAGVL
ncbi:hypothetical protein B0T26DRAFT_296726 [Lasiosphaeria miniovina]|uniref:Uncharacterized protein n=1 Tax=Lasiosphaeria miniovina TaxID=1954250 RepID=A0AA40AKB6_9PEZI|nr:uncharacterized protein B0T26DRAFT_296726 [Lasiosphaeria miniovina]KAK0717431.1 hypothetical protein B0T26DRAFT_296726 [Lasiosphaeria miniovina]